MTDNKRVYIEVGDVVASDTVEDIQEKIIKSTHLPDKYLGLDSNCDSESYKEKIESNTNINNG